MREPEPGERQEEHAPAEGEDPPATLGQRHRAFQQDRQQRAAEGETEAHGLSVFGELGGTAPSKPDLVRQADPSLYVKAGDPPFLIIQGAQDGLVVPAHAHRLYDALKAKGVDATLDIVPGGGHVPYGDEEHRATREFFRRVFGRP